MLHIVMLLFGAMMTKIKLYKPHPGQKILHNSEARFRLATCGRRWGKTYGAANEIMKAAWENNKTVNWWVGPVYKQTVIAFRIVTNRWPGAIK